MRRDPLGYLPLLGPVEAQQVVLNEADRVILKPRQPIRPLPLPARYLRCHSRAH